MQKRPISLPETNSELLAAVKGIAEEKIRTTVNTVLSKDDRSETNAAIATEVNTSLAEKFPEQEDSIKQILHDIEKYEMREMILAKKKRLDGEDWRTSGRFPLNLASCRVHTVPLFLLARDPIIDDGDARHEARRTNGRRIAPKSTRRFMLHYNFPRSASEKQEDLQQAGVKSDMATLPNVR